MVKGRIDSIESFGLVDGPGIRAVVFFTGCKLRCKYCHNPETWRMGDENYTPEELARKLVRFKPYFTRNSGGVTFSGGEPLLQPNFLIETCKLLKNEGIHIALDTAGVGIGNYEEILENVDLVLLDVKHTDPVKYFELTGLEMKECFNFIEAVNKMNKKVWIRQVIVPGLMDNLDYIKSLVEFLKPIKNIERVDFLPFHKMGSEKYKKLGIPFPYESLEEMDKEKCQDLYLEFMKMYEEEKKSSKM